MNAAPTPPHRFRAWHAWVAGGVIVLLLGYRYWRSGSFGLGVMLFANLVLVGGVTWLFVYLALERRRAELAGFEIIQRLQLESAPTDESSLGQYPWEVLQAYRGIYDGAAILWLKVWAVGARSGGSMWVASTELWPAFEQEFCIDASYAPKPTPAPHPRLPAHRKLSLQPDAWVVTWLDALPAEAAAALKEFLGREQHSVVTNRKIFCVVPLLGSEAAGAAEVAFKEIVALGRRLAKSASEQNPFDIHTSFHYVRYTEGKNALELTIDPGMTGASVYVPTAENWPKEVPAWAAQRREEIIGRLRAHLDRQFEFVDSE